MSSFVADKIVMDGLTFDDVLLIPAYSEVLPKTVELQTKFTRNIALNIPFVTAAMDTVTESAMAIAIAREGGIGVIHKNMSIADQARQVAIVKRAENGMIYDPVTIRRGSTVKDALDMMAEYHIGGIPVVDDEGHLVGIVTNRDLRFERRLDRKVDDVMTSENLVTTHMCTDLSDAAQILQENKIEKLPVVDSDNKLVGLITYKDITKAKDKPMACKDEKGRLRVAAGVGVTTDTLDRIQALVEANADAIVIDTAHGHSKGVIEKLREAKAAFPGVDIVVGNVATGAAAKMLVDNGADAYVTKPISLKYLRTRIDRLIAQSDNAAITGELAAEKKSYNKEEQIFLLRCREVIDANLANEDFNMDYLADKLAMSHSALYKKVKTITGMSLIEFVNEYKVYKAVQMFKRGASNIENVANQCGFNDIKTFREAFKRKMKVTPKQYVQGL